MCYLFVKISFAILKVVVAGCDICCTFLKADRTRVTQVIQIFPENQDMNDNSPQKRCQTLTNIV